MSASNAPFGVRPAFSLTGGIIRPRALAGGIASTYASNIFMGTPVLITTNGVLNASTSTSADFVGVFAGCEYSISNGARRIIDNKWISGTAYDAGSMIAYFYDDPMMVYEVQADGSVAQTAVGDQVNLTNAAGTITVSGSTTTGLSSATVGATPVGATNQGMFRVLDKGYQIDNDWGDAFTILRVQIARHSYLANKVAF